MDFSTRLRNHLRMRRRGVVDDRDAIPCGVLVPILRDERRHSVLYTLRSELLPNHKGQVSFPGGKQSPGDVDLLETALREAREEVGLDPADVEVIGRLDDVYTMVTEYLITPFVGIVPAGYSFDVNPAEVTDIFTVPLADLVDPGYHTTETKSFRGGRFDVDVITAGPHNIWGATHRITTNLIEVLEHVPEVA